MDTPSQVTPYLILTGVLLAPALVFLTVFTLARIRRSKFRHQRSHRRHAR